MPTIKEYAQQQEQTQKEIEEIINNNINIASAIQAADAEMLKKKDELANKSEQEKTEERILQIRLELLKQLGFAIAQSNSDLLKSVVKDKILELAEPFITPEKIEAFIKNQVLDATPPPNAAPPVQPQPAQPVPERQAQQDLARAVGEGAPIGLPLPPTPPAPQVQPAPEKPKTGAQAAHNLMSAHLEAAIQEVVNEKLDNTWSEANTKDVHRILTKIVKDQEVMDIKKTRFQGVLDGLNHQITSRGTELAAKISPEQIEGNKQKRADAQRKQAQAEQSEKDAQYAAKLAQQIAEHDQSATNAEREAGDEALAKSLAEGEQEPGDEPPPPARIMRLIGDDPEDPEAASFALAQRLQAEENANAAAAANVRRGAQRQPVLPVIIEEEPDEQPQGEDQIPIAIVQESQRMEEERAAKQKKREQEEQAKLKEVSRLSAEEAEKQKQKEQQEQADLEKGLRLSAEDTQKNQQASAATTSPATTGSDTPTESPPLSLWQRFVRAVQKAAAAIKTWFSNLLSKPSEAGETAQQQPPASSSTAAASSVPPQTAAQTPAAAPGAKAAAAPGQEQPSAGSSSNQPPRKQGPG